LINKSRDWSEYIITLVIIHTTENLNAETNRLNAPKLYTSLFTYTMAPTFRQNNAILRERLLFLSELPEDGILLPKHVVAIV
jgi:hypothetical protein